MGSYEEKRPGWLATSTWCCASTKKYHDEDDLEELRGRGATRDGGICYEQPQPSAAMRAPQSLESSPDARCHYRASRVLQKRSPNRASQRYSMARPLSMHQKGQPRGRHLVISGPTNFQHVSGEGNLNNFGLTERDVSPPAPRPTSTRMATWKTQNPPPLPVQVRPNGTPTRKPINTQARPYSMALSSPNQVSPQALRALESRPAPQGRSVNRRYNSEYRPLELSIYIDRRLSPLPDFQKCDWSDSNPVGQRLTFPARARVREDSGPEHAAAALTAATKAVEELPAAPSTHDFAASNVRRPVSVSSQASVEHYSRHSLSFESQRPRSIISVKEDNSPLTEGVTDILALPAPAVSKVSRPASTQAANLRTSSSLSHRHRTEDVDSAIKELNSIVEERRNASPAPRRANGAHTPALAPRMEMHVRSETLNDIGSAFRFPLTQDASRAQDSSRGPSRLGAFSPPPQLREDKEIRIAHEESEGVTMEYYTLADLPQTETEELPRGRRPKPRHNRSFSRLSAWLQRLPASAAPEPRSVGTTTTIEAGKPGPNKLQKKSGPPAKYARSARSSSAHTMHRRTGTSGTLGTMATLENPPSTLPDLTESSYAGDDRTETWARTPTPNSARARSASAARHRKRSIGSSAGSSAMLGLRRNKSMGADEMVKELGLGTGRAVGVGGPLEAAGYNTQAYTEATKKAYAQPSPEPPMPTIAALPPTPSPVAVPGDVKAQMQPQVQSSPELQRQSLMAAPQQPHNLQPPAWDVSPMNELDKELSVEGYNRPHSITISPVSPISPQSPFEVGVAGVARKVNMGPQTRQGPNVGMAF